MTGPTERIASDCQTLASQSWTAEPREGFTRGEECKEVQWSVSSLWECLALGRHPCFAFHSKLCFLQDETRRILLLNITWKSFYVAFSCRSEKNNTISPPLQISHRLLCNCVQNGAMCCLGSVGK